MAIPLSQLVHPKGGHSSRSETSVRTWLLVGRRVGSEDMLFFQLVLKDRIDKMGEMIVAFCMDIQIEEGKGAATPRAD